MKPHPTLAAALLAPGLALAAEAAPPAYSPAGNVLQMLFGLGVVLLVMWACAKLLKRYGSGHAATPGALRVLGGVAVGQRERVVMVEVGGTWVIVGVAPGRVNALHVMDKLPDSAIPAATANGAGFAGVLSRFAQRKP